MRRGFIPLLLGAAWAAALYVFDLRRLQRLNLPAFDNAYFEQLAWGISHGSVFHSSFLQGNFLGLHFSPLLVLPGLLEIAWPGVQTLNLLSAVAIGAVAPAGYLAGRAILPRSAAGSWLAVLIAVVLPFTPPLQEAGWAVFHPEELALPAILLATWAGFTRRWWLMAPLVLVTLMAKEDQAYSVVVLGLLLWRAGVSRRAGIWTIAAAAAWTGAVVLVAMPWLRHGMSTDISNYYAWLWAGGPGAILGTDRLGQIAGAVAGPKAWQALFLTVLALGLLPLLRPGVALLAVPPLVAATLSRHQPQPLLHLQYGLPIVYPLVVAAALGGRRALEFHLPRRAVFTAALVPGIAVALSGSLPLQLAKYVAGPDPGILTSITWAMDMVPADAELDTDDSLATAVAARANLHLLPHLSRRAFVFVDTAGRIPAYMDSLARNRVVQSLASDRRLLWSDGRLQLWGPAFRESAHRSRDSPQRA